MPDLLDQRRPIDQRKSAAFMRDAKRDGAANALRRARNDGDLAAESFCEDQHLTGAELLQVVRCRHAADVEEILVLPNAPRSRFRALTLRSTLSAGHGL